MNKYNIIFKYITKRKLKKQIKRGLVIKNQNIFYFPNHNDETIFINPYIDISSLANTKFVVSKSYDYLVKEYTKTPYLINHDFDMGLNGFIIFNTVGDLIKFKLRCNEKINIKTVIDTSDIKTCCF